MFITFCRVVLPLALPLTADTVICSSEINAGVRQRNILPGCLTVQSLSVVDPLLVKRLPYILPHFPSLPAIIFANTL